MDNIKTALIGNPTEHSVSDILFSYLYSSLKMPQNYSHTKITVNKLDLPILIEKLIKQSYLGFNVTLPYKRIISKYLTVLDKSALQVSAVNTVKIKDGKTIGYNTDWEGIYIPIYERFDKGNYEICILGTGGASRAAIKAAKELTSGSVYVLYRNLCVLSENTKDLMTNKEKYGVYLIPYENSKSIIKNSDIIINTTPIGMVGIKDKLPIDLSELTRFNLNCKIFMDAVFNPVETELLRFFKKNGSYTIDGLWMMIYQGVAALSIWLDKEVRLLPNSFLEIHKKLEDILNERNFNN